MARLRGEGIGGGMVLGTAAVVRVRSGVPVLPEPPERIAGLQATHRFGELPDVILVADDYATALVIAGMLPWGKVAGIAASRAEPQAPTPPMPAVVNVPQLLETVEDDMLVLIDATRGVVVADPDGTAVARYQAERDRIAPRTRVYLDAAHLAARTMDGRDIQVIAHVQTSGDLEAALAEGADALYVPVGCALLPDGDPGAQKQRLVRLSHLAAGKPLIVFDDGYSLAPSALAQAGIYAEITVAVPARHDLPGLGLRELDEELRAEEARCFDNEIECAMPRLAAHVEPMVVEPREAPDLLDRVAQAGAGRVVLSPAPRSSDRDGLIRTEALVTAAIANFLHAIAEIHFALPDADDTPDGVTALDHIVGAGCAGLIVSADAVTWTKNAVRGLSFSERREALLESLTTTDVL